MLEKYKIIALILCLIRFCKNISFSNKTIYMTFLPQCTFQYTWGREVHSLWIQNAACCTTCATINDSWHSSQRASPLANFGP